MKVVIEETAPKNLSTYETEAPHVEAETPAPLTDPGSLWLVL